MKIIVLFFLIIINTSIAFSSEYSEISFGISSGWQDGSVVSLYSNGTVRVTLDRGSDKSCQYQTNFGEKVKELRSYIPAEDFNKYSHIAINGECEDHTTRYLSFTTPNEKYFLVNWAVKESCRLGRTIPDWVTKIEEFMENLYRSMIPKCKITD